MELLDCLSTRPSWHKLRGRSLKTLVEMPGRQLRRVCADGTVLAQGRSVEVARRQADGTWKTQIDHAIGASS